MTTLEQQIDSLAGPDYIVWKYDVPVKYVVSESPMAEVFEVGDVLHSTVVVDRSVPDHYPSEEDSNYHNPVFRVELSVTREGETVWSASGEATKSNIALNTNRDAEGRQEFRLS